MSAQRIVVTVATDGSVTAETQGMTGAACLDHISALEDLIAGSTVTSTFTDDYFRTTASVTATADAATSASAAHVDAQIRSDVVDGRTS